MEVFIFGVYPGDEATMQKNGEGLLEKREGRLEMDTSSVVY